MPYDIPWNQMLHLFHTTTSTGLITDGGIMRLIKGQAKWTPKDRSSVKDPCSSINLLTIYHKTWTLSNRKCKKMCLDFTYNPSKASIFNTVKKYWYPVQATYPIYVEVAICTPPALSPPLLVHAVHPSTMCARCVVTSDNIGGFAATIWSHEERHIWACCYDVGFRLVGVSFMHEKHKCQWD